ncbi:Metallo-hydrolase/oxidoreductase [Lentinus tigrinus ALCF2SS1-6]|uniref:Metallo-hydrolase/oxidoreductase n=1 Tax=Lentinus tigrinus ALCF2SS1-6 TaxID=1328759 RepID=A0A5C2SIT1_9APHY|nr:Metallo-hydrolase/oxidoreductase [Lentinus tigrinus ALCF2SS1-6]
MSLPPPSPNQAYCHVSALDAGAVKTPLAWILDGASDDAFIDVPALAFLIRHTSKPDLFLFDLGIRRDFATALPPHTIKYLSEQLRFDIKVPQDVVEALAKGDTKPSDITHILISHLHFDHTGDASLFANAQVLSGEGARPLIEDGWPKNPTSAISQETLPEGRTTFLDPEGWPALGPFPHALDFYGDGSLYIVDAGPGHLPGHMNVLARTSADGGWIYLAGDSAHEWSLIHGTGKIGHHPIFGCAHRDVSATEAHIGRIRTLMRENSRVRVLLAHDAPWYAENRVGKAFWPGEIESL